MNNLLLNQINLNTKYSFNFNEQYNSKSLKNLYYKQNVHVFVKKM